MPWLSQGKVAMVMQLVCKYVLNSSRTSRNVLACHHLLKITIQQGRFKEHDACIYEISDLLESILILKQPCLSLIPVKYIKRRN